MFGLIGRFVAQPGRRDDLVAAMTSEVGDLPGCRSFVVAEDPADTDALWITEVWDDRDAWEASLQLPAVRASIEVAMPLIREMGAPTETVPVSVRGL